MGVSNKFLIPLVLILALLGGAYLLHLSNGLENDDKRNNNVNIQLFELDNLNSKLTQLVLRSRLSLDSSYDELADTTNMISVKMNEFSNKYLSDESVSDSLFEQQFHRFKEEVILKIDYVENFKSANSVLRNSDKYVPIVGKELISVSNQNGLAQNAQLYEDIIIDTLLYTKVSEKDKSLNAERYTELLAASEQAMPKSSTVKLIELSNHISTLEKSKEDTQSYLEQAVSVVDNGRLQQIQSAWNELQFKNNKPQNLKYYSIAYVLLMMALLSWLAIRLRNAYKYLDNQVKEKTNDIKVAYEELRVSEKQLAQNEKMATIGQLVAGVAHQVNTPLGYAGSNIDIVKSKLVKMAPLFESIQSTYDALTNKTRDNVTVKQLLNNQIKLHATAKNINYTNLIELLDDSNEGLGSIKETVKSLTEYSHVDSKQFEPLELDDVVSKALKQCKPRAGDRKFYIEKSKHGKCIKGIENQLTQIVVNLVNNAIDATHEFTGEITIRTISNENNVHLSIVDNGEGIDSSLLEKIFDPFYTTKDVGEGTGLGLTICNQIATAHEAKMIINSKENVGTTITVVFPKVVTEQLAEQA